MARIYIYIFSLLLANGIFPDAISRKDLNILKQTCTQLFNDKKFSEAIPYLEKYLSFKNEIKFKIYLAKSLLLRTDLESPEELDEIFLRNEKITNCKKNYKKASEIFSEVVPFLEKNTPRDKEIGELYFLWAYAEFFGEDNEKAISLFQKSFKFNPSLKRVAEYNTAVLFEELGQTKDSHIYFERSLK